MPKILPKRRCWSCNRDRSIRFWSYYHPDTPCDACRSLRRHQYKMRLRAGMRLCPGPCQQLRPPEAFRPAYQWCNACALTVRRDKRARASAPVLACEPIATGAHPLGSGTNK